MRCLFAFLLIGMLCSAIPADAQRLFVGLEEASPQAKSSDLTGFPDVTWTSHAAFDISGAAATPDGVVYVCNGAFTTRLYRFPLDGEPEYLCTLSRDIAGMGYGNGVLYGFSNYASPRGIYTIDPESGQTALAVDLQASGFRFFALDFNPSDGLLYGYTEYGSPTGLYSIDPASGATAFVTGAIPASNTQGRALAVGNNTVYLAATRGADDVPLFAYSLSPGSQWVPFTQPYPQSHATGGATWVPEAISGLESGSGSSLLRFEGIAPNPIRDGARITWRSPSVGSVRLEVLDVAGRRIALLEEASRLAGVHTVSWNGADQSGHRLPSGVYYLRLEAGGAVSTAPVLIVR